MSLPKSSAFRATRGESKKNLSNAPFPLEVINSFGGYIRSSVAADHRGAEREERDETPCATVPESSVGYADGFHTGTLCDSACLDPSHRHEIQDIRRKA